jgi:hypothetical protein
MFWKKEKTEKTEEIEKIFVRDRHMDELIELAAKINDSDSKYHEFRAKRNLWLFLEENYPVIKEGYWTLNADSWPRWCICRQ